MDGETGRWNGVVTGPRTGRMRDRRGRGRRGPIALPGPLTPHGIRSQQSPREQFDAVVRAVVTALGPAFRAEPDPVEVVVEEAPRLPPEWADEVPASVVTHVDGTTRVVVFRLPIVQRCGSRRDLEEMTWAVLLEQLASVWQVNPDDLDPR
ncbi:MAG: metallopeptidase family protein [Aeromicrobium sp.]